MKKTILPIIVAMAFLPLNRIMAQHNLNLMPLPAEVTIDEGNFVLPSETGITVTGNYDPRLTEGIKWFTSRLESFSQGKIKSKLQKDQGQISIIVDHPGILSKDEDESYSLSVSKNGVNLEAPTDLGALHGLETLLQLLSAENGSWQFQAVRIKDNPRFAWRGLLIDVGRHFMPLSTIKRNIDG
ncbi:MAG TPA: glycoside hydrolase family 20 zincin-like fold domain-containing protein, partial [Bacteroidales bacterium]|nr:glycoside hydrolase family 20 zincin-like fold domain-containing protein [Bacteroidales bacterium]